jgi:hypothetical protein
MCKPVETGSLAVCTQPKDGLAKQSHRDNEAYVRSRGVPRGARLRCTRTSKANVVILTVARIKAGYDPEGIYCMLPEEEKNTLP